MKKLFIYLFIYSPIFAFILTISMKSVSVASTFETTTIADGDRYWDSTDVTTNAEDIDIYAPGHQYQGIFEFNISALPENASISAADLNLTVYRFYDFSPNTINFPWVNPRLCRGTPKI